MNDIVAASSKRTGPGYVLRRWGKALLRNDAVLQIASAAVYQFMKLTNATQRNQSAEADPWSLVEPNTPAIIALWHGQHFMVPFMMPKGKGVDALISKNADAEINARVLKKMGVRTIRGSGGRDAKQNLQRGGAKALLKLRRSLSEGRNVVIIADISHGQRRQAGEGIVALARISGRPIIPVAYATSKRFVFEKSWDKATLNLPFGKRGFAVGEPIFVAEKDTIADKQLEVTNGLNIVTRRAAFDAGIEVVS